MPFPHLFLLVGAVILVMMVPLWFASLQIKNAASLVIGCYFHGSMMRTLLSSAACPRYAKPQDSEIVFSSE
jgi:hypothetical protein